MPIVKHLIADQFGSHIGKYSERLKVTQKGETLQQAPLIHLESVSVLSKGVSLSADALAACSEAGIPIYFVDSRGIPYASIYAAGLTGTVLTRREQLRAYDDERGLHLGVSFAQGKIQNQAITLKYLAKNRKETPEGEALQSAAEEVLDFLHPLDRLTRQATIDSVRDQLMGCEGNAARRYWEAVRLVLPADYGWQAREGRGATDPINSLLNYGYGILYGQIERALVLAGLDPYAGFVHADRPGKPSLVLDLIEEFRQVAVDRVVFGLANRRFTVEQDERGRMSEATRRAFAQHILDHLESNVRHEGKKYPLRSVIQLQARQIVTFVRRERSDYVPFKASW
ncbi:MAG: CRISPR-associated endonuclease Cas1 [Caldilineaceae bacterium]|nr:CRISPR-associated endonuclease Cas1 [Caldilineaceae bacterium]